MQQYFIIESVSVQNFPIFWCGCIWSSNKEEAKRYSSRKRAESSANRIGFKFYNGEYFDNPLTVEEVIEAQK